jgi:hypothetical protein
VSDPEEAVNEAVRAAVRDLAGEARPVFLGDRAVRAVQRRNRWVTAAAGLAVTLVVAGVAAVALGADLARPPEGTAPDGAATASRPATAGPPAPEPGRPWPVFGGLGEGVPAAAQRGDRLVVAAYATGVAGPAHVLDPATGAYRPAGADAVLTVSPDLRYAVVMRTAEEGGTVGREYGIYDTGSATVLGRLDVAAWLDPSGEYDLSRADWSPDGRSVALSVRRAVPGLGWLATRVLLLDARTGAVRAAGIEPHGGLEPVELLGWTGDSAAVVFTADRIGTDQAPGGHLLYAPSGRALAARSWPGQANAVRVTGTDDVALLPLGGGDIAVVGLRDGAVRARYPAAKVRDVAGGWESPLAWRGDELIVRSEDCSAAGCSPGTELVGVAAASGDTHVLGAVPKPWQTLVVVPVVGPIRAVAPLTW